MAISIKTVGRSILESMLFLALLSAGLTLLGNLPMMQDGNDALYGFSLLFVSAAASMAVALVFPKPTYWRAFWKFFLGAMLTIAVFFLLMLIVGPVILSGFIDLLWGTGGLVWDWASGNGLAAGIVAVFFYVIFTAFFLGVLFAGLFALTNLLVMLAINVIIDKRNESNGSNPSSGSPF